MNHHIPFQSIDNFHSMRKHVMKHAYKDSHILKYKGKIKLHGTNFGCRVTKDAIYPQARNRDISILSDNAGAAFFIESRKEALLKLWDGKDFIVYGEFCGPSIQKGVALTQLPNKILAIFEVQYGESDVEGSTVVFEPEDLIAMGFETIPDVYVLPWETDELVLDLHSIESCEAFCKSCNDKVLEVEKCDPWVKRMFNIEGIGEGLVYYKIGVTLRSEISFYQFKAKGVEHSVVKSRAPVQLNAERVVGANAFAELVVTGPRCEQGLDSVGVANTKNTGAFLSFIARDILKECMAELEATGLEWKEVCNAVNAAARQWFLNKCKELA